MLAASPSQGETITLNWELGGAGSWVLAASPGAELLLSKLRGSGREGVMVQMSQTHCSYPVSGGFFE